MATRLKDIAKDLGVSVVTVSKVLHNHTDIGEETRRRVLEKVKELNYRPNSAARALITGRSQMVGAILPDLLHPFFAQVAKALSGELRKNGFGLLISSSDGDPELERSEIDELLSRGVDALVIASAETTPETFRRIDEHGTPYVLIDRSFEDHDRPFTGADDHAAGVMATEHLIEQGCQRIAHIRGLQISTARHRMEGYIHALERHGLPVRPEYLASTAPSSDGRGHIVGRQAMEALLECRPMPDAVFCYNDPVALGAMGAILDAGLRIPEDIAVVGSGNVLYSEFLRVPLTTIDQQSQSIGEHAAALTLAAISKVDTGLPRKILTAPQLVVRESSRRKS